MKLHIDCAAGLRTGPGTFAARLGAELQRMGHAIVGGSEADASIVFIEPTGAPLARKVVQRLDGIWFAPHEFESKNAGIRDLYARADAVVWQSSFDRGMTLRWWGEPKRGIVVRNGAGVARVDRVTIPRLEEMAATYDRIYVCSSNWHPQKRLQDNVRLFEQLRARMPNSCLIIMGAAPDHRASGPHVFYTGSVDPATCAQVYSVANWMIHLAWADHCPNVVVEALAQGTPVVCSSVGGTKELIGGYGLVIDELPYDYELVDYENPPPVDLSGIVELPDRSQLDYSTVPDVSISSCAARYVDVLKEVL